MMDECGRKSSNPATENFSTPTKRLKFNEMSEINKKPILNPNRLEWEFAQLLKNSRYGGQMNKVIERFMLSGTQQNSLYNCSMFKPILKAIAASETEVSIQSLPEGNLGDEIFEALIPEGVKDVFFLSKPSEKHFSHLCNITTITRFSCPLKYSDLSLLKSKPQNFKFEVNFKEMNQTKSEKKIILPWVTKLRIVILIESSDFTKESMKFLIKLIPEIFPNIETIDFAFYFVNPTWKPIYSIMKEINEEWFQDFPENIKGEIDLHASCGSNSSYKVVITELIAGDNEYVDCTQAVKYFDIRKDLTFSFRLNYD